MADYRLFADARLRNMLHYFFSKYKLFGWKWSIPSSAAPIRALGDGREQIRTEIVVKFFEAHFNPVQIR